MLDGDVALFDIDIRSPVFTHGAEFDQVTIGPEFAQGEKQVQGSDYIIYLSKHRMLAVDH